MVADPGRSQQQVEALLVRVVGHLGAASGVVDRRAEVDVESTAVAVGHLGRALGDLEFALGEGPVRDCWSGSRPVLVADLGREAARWPALVPAATAAGLCAVHAFPLVLGAARLGVLSLCFDHPRALDDAEVGYTLVVAEVVTSVVLTSMDPEVDPDGLDAPGPQGGHIRSEVHQAQGMVMVQLGVGPGEAMARMRACAYAEGIGLDAVALQIVDGRRTMPRDEDT